MSESVGSQGGELEVTPEEERFLKRFFRRQMLPWLLAFLVMAVTSGLWFRDDGGSASEARSAAAVAQLRADNQRLREQLESLAQGVQARLDRPDGSDELERRVEDARQNVRMIEARVSAALDRRIDALESRLGAAPASPARTAPEAPPPDASAWDVSSILDRLYALEMRQEQDAAARDRAATSGTARLSSLESRVARLEGSAPAAAP